MTIQESAEMYLETILILSKEKDSVRAIDVAKKLNYSKPSVSRAMKNLNNNGYISERNLIDKVNQILTLI